jgi:hypothetical protein
LSRIITRTGPDIAGNDVDLVPFPTRSKLVDQGTGDCTEITSTNPVPAGTKSPAEITLDAAHWEHRNRYITGIEINSALGYPHSATTNYLSGVFGEQPASTPQIAGTPFSLNHAPKGEVARKWQNSSE